MLESLPSRSSGRTFALGVIIFLFLLVISLAYLIISEPITLLTFLWVLAIIATIPTIFVVNYWRATLSNARYLVENLILEIKWGRLSHSIPLNEIKALWLVGEGVKRLRFRGINWPGLTAGFGEFQDGQRTFQAKIYSTRSTAEGLFIETGSEVFLISPTDPVDFKTCIEALNIMPETEKTQGSIGFPLLPQSALWRDKLSQILLAAPIILNLLLFGILTALMNRLDGQVPLHFDSTGVVVHTGTPANLLILPVIGLVAWSLALGGGLFFYIWRDERPMAQIIWAMTIVIELAAWAAVIILLV
ncbi:MAG: PH domain-containing protein [Anaerolineae bacterium]|nr:MAG: PH domain-containing protein [Anaerolineae bacterium]